jgi:hypothetical protein
MRDLLKRLKSSQKKLGENCDSEARRGQVGCSLVGLGSFGNSALGDALLRRYRPGLLLWFWFVRRWVEKKSITEVQLTIGNKTQDHNGQNYSDNYSDDCALGCSLRLLGHFITNCTREKSNVRPLRREIAGQA